MIQAVTSRPAHERRWPASLAVAVVIVIQLVLPRQTAPSWWPALVAAEALMLSAVVAGNPLHLNRVNRRLRVAGAALAVLVIAVNGVRLAQLLLAIADGRPLTAKTLVASGGLIWVTNVVATAVAFWELDGAGPFARAGMTDGRRPADLLFPQMTGLPGWDPETWRPSFFDYVFVAFTTATAFSPTDTMPTTGRAKALMMLTAGVSLLTVGVVAARAVSLF